MSNVKQILRNNGVKITSENDSGFAQFCPSYRNSKNPMGASINLKTGWVIDWSQDEKFPLDVLIKKLGGKELSKKDLENLQPIFEQADEKEKTFWKRDSLVHFLPNHTYWLDRGVSKETLDFFQGGVSHSGKLYQRYVWPVFDRHQRIVGFTGRDLSGEAKIKYKHEGKSSYFLFGLFNKLGNSTPILSSILEANEVILVEGPSDSVACYDEGVKFVLPTIGLNISRTLMSFLIGINPDKITISYNRDDNFAGQNAAVKNFAKLAQHFDIEKLSIKYPTGNDLSDNKKDIQSWVHKNEDSAIFEFREKFKRLRNNNKKMTQQEIKIGKMF